MAKDERSESIDSRIDRLVSKRKGHRCHWAYANGGYDAMSLIRNYPRSVHRIITDKHCRQVYYSVDGEPTNVYMPEGYEP